MMLACSWGGGKDDVDMHIVDKEKKTGEKF